MAIRVFLVDDSTVSRLVLRRTLEKSQEFVIVGEAKNGKAAIEQIPEEEVDIVLMDLMMPVMDGFDATSWLMENSPVPILLVSDLVGRDAALNFRAVEAGALDVIRKPSADELNDPAVVSNLYRMIRILSNVPVVTRRRKRRSSRQDPASQGVGLDVQTEPRVDTAGPEDDTNAPSEVSLVVIGASTGGPAAVSKLLRELTNPPPWPIVIVQHITRHFAAGMARWLDNVSDLSVQLVEERTRLQDGMVYIATDSADLVVNGRYLDLVNEDEQDRSYPSIDVTINSVVRSSIKDQVLAILLTGMGSDGTTALKELRHQGGWTIAQDRDSSTVWGIPRVAHEIGAACQVLSLDEISKFLNSLDGTDHFGAP